MGEGEVGRQLQLQSGGISFRRGPGPPGRHAYAYTRTQRCAHPLRGVLTPLRTTRRCDTTPRSVVCTRDPLGSRVHTCTCLRDVLSDIARHVHYALLERSFRISRVVLGLSDQASAFCPQGKKAESLDRKNVPAYQLPLWGQLICPAAKYSEGIHRCGHEEGLSPQRG